MKQGTGAGKGAGATPGAAGVPPPVTPVPDPDKGSTAPPTVDFPVVGIGASAGGLAAFEAFFSGMPAAIDPGMAFVLVQHLAPDHESILTDLIRRYTRMEVFEVTDGMAVRANCAYIIPPGHDMAFINGTLQLLKPAAPRGQRLPIDFFFRSLAQDQRERAIGIVLSGTGSDGTQGIRAIKGEGGMVMAQTPDSSEYDGMPCSAIATGLVDYQLSPAEMPPQLIAYATRAIVRRPGGTLPVDPGSGNALKKIFILLRDKVGHDFSQYKQNTTCRRIERRMAVHQIETMGDYATFMQQTPAEVEALFRDLLIGVTGFFRDPEVFKQIEERIIPGIVTGKGTGETIRVWSPGCSSGEEAYSLAILLAEQLGSVKSGVKGQVFATDIDGQAIAAARAGIYPSGIAAVVSPERLARFFSPEGEGGGYRIHKAIREMMVFSEQDLIKDPPFSRIDLISCRNLLIYLSVELQRMLIPLFHFALNPGGYLLLGTSETVGEFEDLFAVVDRKSRIYRKIEGHQRAVRTLSSGYSALVASTEHPALSAARRPASPVKRSLREVTEGALLQLVTPAGALVTGEGKILYLHGRTGMYLEPAAGETGVSNILKMAREGLRRDLAMALRKAVETQEVVACPGLRVKANSHFVQVDLTIRPVAGGDAAASGNPLYLVVLQEAPPRDPEQAAPVAGQGMPGANGPDGDIDGRITALQQELQARDESLKTYHDEVETANEELKSSNEELQSVNEELQSANEELETSKEEMQSVNEELTTVNAELRARVEELTRANNDIKNLLAGTGIATIFVDLQLRIVRFTPAAAPILNMIPGDVGRPVVHLAANLVGLHSLQEEAQAVLDTLVPRETEVQGTDGRWYLLRIQPYRTVDNVIEGAVITFVDITEPRRAREALQETEPLRRLAVVVRDTHDAVMMIDLEGRILAWNPGAQRKYGWSEAEALAMNIRSLIPEELRGEALAVVRRLATAETIEPYRTQRVAKNGRLVGVRMTATALVNESGQVYAIATTERAPDLTDKAEEGNGKGTEG